MIQIVPSLLIRSASEFEEKLRLVEPHVTHVHVDIMDGSLYPDTTWFDAVRVGALRTNVLYELHLMVENPLPIIEAWKQHVPTTARAIIHAEIKRPLGAVLTRIKQECHLETGVALAPETPLQEIEDVLHTIDQLTIMGVHPGKSGQEFLGEPILEKIRQAKHHRDTLPIEIDGGVNLETLPLLVQAGCSRICTASLLFDNNHPKEQLQQLKNLIQ